MPQTINRKRTARQVRKRADARKNTTGPRRKRSHGSTAQTPRIIANSLFAVTLKPIPGVAVANVCKGAKHLRNDEDDYEKMYKDLLKSLHNACRLIGIETKCDPYKEGMELSASLAYVINVFEKEILPSKQHGEFQFKYNIDKDDNGYYFTIYKYCEMQQFWHAFEIRHLVKYLRRKNKKLHDVFIVFLKSFMYRTDISAWYNGALGYADYWFDEEVEFWWDNHDIEDKTDRDAYDEALKTKDIYEKGEARRYQKLLEKSVVETPEKLIDILSHFSKKNKFVKWMIEACKFMQKDRACISNFIYEEDEEGQEGLKFDQQVGVIWDLDDEYTHAQEEAIDSDANNVGVLSPCLTYYLSPHTKSFNINELHEATKIPMQITKLFNHYYDVVNPLRNAKRKN